MTSTRHVYEVRPAHNAVIHVYDEAGNVMETQSRLAVSKNGSAIKMFATTGSVAHPKANVATKQLSYAERFGAV
jgi:hypothetical protein